MFFTSQKRRRAKPVFALTRFNGQATHVITTPTQLFHKPERLSYEQAATLPVVYLTAYQLLVVMGNLQPEETVLIHNVGGGVGLAATDIARHLGAKIIGTASKHKHKFLESRGVSHAIDYTKGPWEKPLNALTGGRGVELITDPLGGSHWRRSFKALRHTGRLGMFGISSASMGGKGSKINLIKTALSMPFYHPIALMNGNKSVFGVNLGHLWHEPEKIRRWMKKIIEGVEQGWINPHIDRCFPFEKSSQAYQHLERRKNIGKVALVP